MQLEYLKKFLLLWERRWLRGGEGATSKSRVKEAGRSVKIPNWEHLEGTKKLGRYTQRDRDREKKRKWETLRKSIRTHFPGKASYITQDRNLVQNYEVQESEIHQAIKVLSQRASIKWTGRKICPSSQFVLSTIFLSPHFPQHVEKNQIIKCLTNSFRC